MIKNDLTEKLAKLDLKLRRDRDASQRDDAYKGLLELSSLVLQLSRRIDMIEEEE